VGENNTGIMGNPNFGRDRTTAPLSTLMHDASRARMPMAAAKIAGVGSSHRPCTHIPHGNMRAKPLDYIEQVFECKAEASSNMK
jgi:hypothetical protein